MSMDKWIGRKVMIIYLDQQQHVSQRVIRILKFENGILHAYDESKRLPRTFRGERVLAMEQVKQHVS
ncbi:WYL domain-containing protein [Paenibacillus sp. HB172176]|uniref:WYL domain-containing protein n=1 Tax=Paenibacillus sp. HB172176 TaxID=2493690 RepID=UPI0014393BE9|nr:WYL domain-containing protein [Paenibacillus sp. HB172176]